MSTLLATPATLLARAREHVARAAGREPAWLVERRKDALARVERRGLPTSRDEDWKYTNVAPIAALALARAPDADLATLREAVVRLRLPVSGGIHVVVVDGRFVPELSSLPPMPGGLTVGSLAEAIRTRPHLVERTLAAVAAGGDRPFADLSTALFEDGVLVHLGKDTCCPVPVDVLHVSTGRGTVAFPRTVIVGEPETRATVVERFVALRPGPYAVVPVTEVALARNAAVEHVAWQDDAVEAFHVATIEAHQERDSRFTSHALTLGAALSRTDTGVRLDGEGAEVTLNGLYLLFGDRHADHHTRIDHARPHGTSRELFKGILDGRVTGVFNGKVVVHPGAVKTDSQQANHNLLLSADAVADTKPELEIYNDDVKCQHGATVGRLDDDKVFYLRSRGLDEKAARDLLVRAFARDVTDRISIEAVHAGLDRWMTERLPSLRGGEAAS
ncbi:MAG TPA: Fe-S cluster assembly protein SufD [Planctomycetota bacterium]|nr:Fe-S cluster assembly protein SufD [Planctomycetota bacterium]